jgi:hypothetical protein
MHHQTVLKEQNGEKVFNLRPGAYCALVTCRRDEPKKARGTGCPDALLETDSSSRTSTATATKIQLAWASCGDSHSNSNNNTFNIISAARRQVNSQYRSSSQRSRDHLRLLAPEFAKREPCVCHICRFDCDECDFRIVCFPSPLSSSSMINNSTKPPIKLSTWINSRLECQPLATHDV